MSGIVLDSRVLLYYDIHIKTSTPFSQEFNSWPDEVDGVSGLVWLDRALGIF